MNFNQTLELGGFLLAILGLFWNFSYGKGKADELSTHLNAKIDSHILDNDKVDGRIFSQLTKIWEWKDAHEREAAAMRLELQKQIGKVEAGLTLNDGRIAEVIRLIQSMRQDFGEKLDDIKQQTKNR